MSLSRELQDERRRRADYIAPCPVCSAPAMGVIVTPELWAGRMTGLLRLWCHGGCRLQYRAEAGATRAEVAAWWRAERERLFAEGNDYKRALFERLGVEALPARVEGADFSPGETNNQPTNQGDNDHE